jgi:hypothetical protein
MESFCTDFVPEPPLEAFDNFREFVAWNKLTALAVVTSSDRDANSLPE